MSIVLADVGAARILETYFKGIPATAGTTLSLRLFANDLTPTDTTALGAFTEAAGGGYARKTLIASECTVSSSGIPSATYPSQTYVFTGPLDTNPSIYGYYVVDADGVLIYAERSVAPITPAIPNDAIEIIPVFKLSKGIPT